MKADNNIDCGKWVRSVNLVAHRVEVKSLIHHKGKLYSGGDCLSFKSVKSITIITNISYLFRY